MEDLVPFLIFIVIAVVNILKFVAEKGGKKAKPTAAGGSPTERRPNTIESFFEELAGKLEPKPTELPDWPEDRERPDYVHQMDGVPHHSFEEPEAAPVPVSVLQPLENAESAEIQASEPIGAFKPQAQNAASVFSGPALRLPILPAQRSSSAGKITFNIKERGKLKQAIIANIIFSQPRAYDCSFDTTLAK